MNAWRACSILTAIDARALSAHSDKPSPPETLLNDQKARMTPPSRRTRSRDRQALELALSCHFVIFLLPSFLTLDPWGKIKSQTIEQNTEPKLGKRSTCHLFFVISPLISGTLPNWAHSTPGWLLRVFSSLKFPSWTSLISWPSATPSGGRI